MELYARVGNGVFSSGGAPQSVFATFGVEAERLATLTWVMVGGAVVIALAVAALFIVAIRAKEGALTHRGGMRLLLWAGGVVPTIILFTLLVATLPQMRPIRAEPGDLRIAVQGEQFWWRVRYQPPGAPAVVAANEVRVPVGRTVAFSLTAGDVLHSFWIPGLAGKVDMVPGRANALVVRATKAGRYRGQCAEFCGLSHALMAFDVVAMEPAAFEAWLSAQRRDAAADDATFAAYGCGGCHAVRGTAHAGAIGPDLTHLATRPTLGAGMQAMTPANLVRFVRDAPSVKPGARMPAYPQMTDAEAIRIARYLETLK
ncbi:cytochrome B [Sphingomonas sp. Leaf412]|uniref:cytochrome c oxidase subunit II n=1 Tax=Sphingomonas sp. Leaf412 TaxID=1736370 RepID=UPI0007000B91|nr:cytochrome c oxidase subunit II [Sphingomonas sp. Leaf412]KQT31389.1 cytochrome B [Sphingomonas sp. Leaf412]